MAPNTGKKPKGQKKEKVFHPLSRKADQLVRTQIRKSKLAELARARTRKHGDQVNLFGFFYHAIPPEGVLTLEDMHSIVKDIWFTRFDAELESERASRRKGRPKSAKEQNLESIKEREAEEYRTGIEVIDLTDPQNVDLFRQWDQKEVAYVQQLRMVRIAGDSPTVAVLSKPGMHPLLKKTEIVESQEESVEMDTDEAPLLLEPPSRFSSTMMTMDMPPS
ncbi:hypothetical protein BXZ70DRAFT_888360 [Cristinia sonorae]|uniref:Translation machinery-associated protein 16 n=1 Tax=Cristinia sonorae TaxID=1940300 RepID=A0A8K0UTZ6_9AGAR|nr:hypothetical protein BXZ70DRAFT_888360 [Cristinia sonorae]